MDLLAPWMDSATLKDKERLAELASTTSVNLYKLAAGEHKPGGALMKRLIFATDFMHVESHFRLPRLTTEKLVTHCPTCGYKLDDKN